MIAYRPKTLFQKNSDERAKFQAMASSDLMHRAIAFAQAEMGFTGFNPQEMAGATAFILIFLNLSESDEPKKPLPIKALTSFDPPAPKPQPNQEGK